MMQSNHDFKDNLGVDVVDSRINSKVSDLQKGWSITGTVSQEQQKPDPSFSLTCDTQFPKMKGQKDLNGKSPKSDGSRSSQRSYAEILKRRDGQKVKEATNRKETSEVKETPEVRETSAASPSVGKSQKVEEIVNTCAAAGATQVSGTTVNVSKTSTKTLVPPKAVAMEETAVGYVQNDDLTPLGNKWESVPGSFDPNKYIYDAIPQQVPLYTYKSPNLEQVSPQSQTKGRRGARKSTQKSSKVRTTVKWEYPAGIDMNAGLAQFDANHPLEREVKPKPPTFKTKMKLKIQHFYARSTGRDDGYDQVVDIATMETKTPKAPFVFFGIVVACVFMMCFSVCMLLNTGQGDIVSRNLNAETTDVTRAASAEDVLEQKEVGESVTMDDVSRLLQQGEFKMCWIKPKNTFMKKVHLRNIVSAESVSNSDNIKLKAERVGGGKRFKFIEFNKNKFMNAVPECSPETGCQWTLERVDSNNEKMWKISAPYLSDVRSIRGYLKYLKDLKKEEETRLATVEPDLADIAELIPKNFKIRRSFSYGPALAITGISKTTEIGFIMTVEIKKSVISLDFTWSSIQEATRSSSDRFWTIEGMENGTRMTKWKIFPIDENSEESNLWKYLTDLKKEEERLAGNE